MYVLSLAKSMTRLKRTIEFDGHSSELRGLCLMKCSSKTLQNLPYFWNMKTHLVFFSFHVTLFFPNECSGLGRHST